MAVSPPAKRAGSDADVRAGGETPRRSEFARRGRRFAAVLAVVLALDGADRSALGVLAPDIKHAFQISNTDLGLLAAAFGVVGGLATIPAGVLTDRMARVRLLAGSIVLWSVAMVIGGLAFSFAVLFAARLALGAVTATGGPTVLSLSGDLFRRQERGRAMSWIRAGEFVGAGLGFLVAGTVAAFVSWRGVFLLFAFCGVVVFTRVARLPEPRRTSDHTEDQPERGLRPLWRAVRYALEVPTYRTIIVAGAVGDFFFAAITVFGVLFAVRQYHVSQATAAMLLPVVGTGALIGILVAGRLTDALIARGVPTARVLVPALCLIGGAFVLVPAACFPSIGVGMPVLLAGGLLLAAPNPPLDAARLDVLQGNVWGRAEGIRTALRVGVQAAGPLAFGLLSDHLANGGAQGMRLAFLIILVPLALSGLVLLRATKTYGSDLAAASSSA